MNIKRSSGCLPFLYVWYKVYLQYTSLHHIYIKIVLLINICLYSAYLKYINFFSKLFYGYYLLGLTLTFSILIYSYWIYLKKQELSF